MKGVIFDMDGVIFDSESLWKEGFVRANEKFGVEFSEEYRLSCCGRIETAIREELRALRPDMDADAYRDCINDYVITTIKTVGAALKDGFLPLVKRLKENGYKIALATSSVQSRMNVMFEKHNLNALELFDEIVSAEDVTRGKPDPEIFLRASERLGLAPQECYVIEDSPNGIKAAYAAGCSPVMVVDLITPDEQTKAVCTAVLNSLSEAETLIIGD